MYLVEVRDANRTRVGQIDPAFLSIQWVEIFNGVGQGELKLPAEHPLLPVLRAHGSGIIITAPGGRVFSGRVRSAQVLQDATDPVGTWTISFEDDSVVVQASVAYPDPANPADSQTRAYDNKRAAGETVMKDYIRNNIGSAAMVSRKYPWLVVAPDLGRGPLTSGSARFDNMGELQSRLGAYAGLGFRCTQVDDNIVFDVYQPIDRSATVRMDIVNDALESTNWGYSRPSATHILVAGQGSGEDRTILEVTTPESITAQAQWGLRWEQFKDQRDTDDPVELQQSGVKILSEEGMTVNSLQVTPSDSPHMAYGKDWGLGDRVTVVVDGQETTAIVTQVAISVTAEGIIVQATVGDPVGFDFESKVVSRIQDQDSRLSALERNAEDSAPWVMPTGTSIEGYWSTPPKGFLFEEGQAVSRTTYSALFAVIGTTFGAGNGTTTFNLPNHNGKVGVGFDSSQAEFNVVGKTGGEKAVTLTVAQMPAHTHIQNAHSHIQDAHNHSQQAHTHTQNAHNHAQDAHNHSQNSHNHNQNAHSHSVGGTGSAFMANGSGGSAANVTTGGGGYQLIAPQNAVATNQATTATNNEATATNQAAIATNQNTTAVNNATTATNQPTVAINQDMGGGGAHNNLQPYITKRFAIKF